MAEPMKGRSVGVIGGGPAGMLAAAYMAKSGAMVTVFERYDPSRSSATDRPRPWWNIGLSPISRKAIEGAGLCVNFDEQFKCVPFHPWLPAPAVRRQAEHSRQCLIC